MCQSIDNSQYGSMSADPAGNNTDMKSFKLKQLYCTPDYLYPLISSISVPSSFSIFLSHPHHYHHSKNTKQSHPSLSLNAIIINWHWVQHTPSTAYTEYSIHRVQHPPKMGCLLFFLTITSLPLNVASASGMPRNMINLYQLALQESWMLKWACYVPIVSSKPTDE